MKADLLTPAEAAALLNVSVKSLTRWATTGRVPVVVTPGGHRRYPRQALLEVIHRKPTRRPDRGSRKPIAATVSTRMPVEDVAALSELAADSGTTIAVHVRAILQDHLRGNGKHRTTKPKL